MVTASWGGEEGEKRPGNVSLQQLSHNNCSNKWVGEGVREERWVRCAWISTFKSKNNLDEGVDSMDDTECMLSMKHMVSLKRVVSAKCMDSMRYIDEE